MKRFPRLNLKNINRLFMLAVVFAPIFYLFGSLFTALNGANGKQLFSSSYESSSSIDNPSVGDIYKIDFKEGVLESSSFVAVDWDNSDSTDVRAYYSLSEDFVNNPPFVSLETDYSSGYRNLRLFTSDDSFYTFSRYNPSTSFWVFSLIPIYVTVLSSDYSLTIPSYASNYVSIEKIYPTISSDYSDFIFGQFFAKDNFLVQMGKDSLSADPNGFAPANSLVQLLDGSVFHFGSENQIACMAYGYAVWVFNAVILDMVIVLALKLTLLPLRAVEIFEKGEKE